MFLKKTNTIGLQSISYCGIKAARSSQLSTSSPLLQRASSYQKKRLILYFTVFKKI